ncbi:MULTISPECIES: nuclear transport factor 2 family protein [Kitasatospora]|uniref:nuclear transport factor 2 family protein n=1 Tax=Kitasatospora TaxID=2063 RepID=UPI0004C43EEC|nr:MULTISPECIES: nuclear transport factor 2 family protein [unclassified Kitasatospora]WAL73588.1 nuclear transport factor 2 family protein [Kitasatospora sp. YST-16]WNW39645.1 nuclear transport factor 2 family protein [Streptomyces sp. Li-HN-5-13]
MSEHNKQLVTQYLTTVWNDGETDEADRFLAEDLVQHNPNLPDGRKPVVEFVAGFKTQVPQGRFTIRRIAADQDLVFVHSHFTAQDGDRGMAVVDVFRIADGLIAEHWDVKENVPETTASGHPIV